MKKPTPKKEDFVALTPQAGKTKATTDQTKNYLQALRKQGGEKKPTEQNPFQTEIEASRKAMREERTLLGKKWHEEKEALQREILDLNWTSTSKSNGSP